MAGLPSAASSATEPPERATTSVGGGHRRRQAVSVGHEVIALKPLAPGLQLGAHGVVVARAADVDQLEGQFAAAERVDTGAVDALRALAAAEGEHAPADRAAGRTPRGPPRRSPRAGPPRAAAP